MSRSKSSRRWLREHFDDPYVKRAQEEGYRSRAVYKLTEMQERDHLIRPGMTVLDLGAAPGGWSQLAATLVGSRGRVIATDILDIEPIPDVTFVPGDFREQAVLDRLLELMADGRADLVISDMAPNMSGVDAVDIPRAMYLAELAFDLAQRVLKPGGDFLVKLFQGAEFDRYVRTLRLHFDRVVVRKPKASRPRSREVYALARGFKLV